MGLVSFLAFSWMAPTPDPDTADFRSFYSPVAQNVLSGNGLETDAGQPAVRYPPGYPMTLAGLYRIADFVSIPRSLALFWFRTLCATLAAGMIGLFAGHLGPAPACWIPAALWSVYPPALWLNSLNLSENAFVPLLLISVYALWRGATGGKVGWWITSGVVAGTCTLFRPIAIGLPLVLVLCGWWISRMQPIGIKVRTGALGLSLAALATVAPWELFALGKTGQLIPLSTAGSAAIHDGLTWSIRDKGYRSHRPASGAIARTMGAVEAAHQQDPSTGSMANALANQALVNPVGLFGLIGWKATRSWYGTDSGRGERVLILVQCLYLAFVAFGMRNALRSGTIGRSMVVLAIGVAGYFWIMTMTGLSIARYTTPAVSLLVLPLLWLVDSKQLARHITTPTTEE